MSNASFLNSQLFDRIIKLTFIHKDSNQKGYELKTPKSGLKPQISISWNRVPGNFCYNCQVRITNLFLAWNIYDVEGIKIVAGYSSSLGERTMSLDCKVFDAYRQTPAPDSICVFDCLTATADSSIFNTRAYDFLFYAKEYSVDAVLSETQKELEKHGNKFIFNTDCLSQGLKNEYWDKNLTYERHFLTGYALLDYLQNHLSEIAQARDKHSVYMTVFGTHVLFLETDESGNPANEPASLSTKLNIPVLDHTTEVTWTSGTLSGTGPWNPDIYPGCTFYCNPLYYTGGISLPNQVARTLAHKDSNDLYYCLTQSVHFSTDGENKMTIKAVRFSTSPAKDVLKDADAQIEELEKKAEEMKQDAKNLKLATVAITLGKKPIIRNSELNKTVSKSSTINGSTWKCPRSTTMLTQYLTFYSKDVGLKPFIGANTGRAPETIPGMYFYYPIVALATAQAAKDKPELYSIDNPNFIILDKTPVTIPSNIDYKSYEKDSSTIRWFREFAQATALTQPEWSAPLSKIADILENGEVLE